MYIEHHTYKVRKHTKIFIKEQNLTMAKKLVLFSCLILLLQIGYASRPLPYEPQECILTVTSIQVCLADFWTYFGRVSEKCCDALKKIDDACVPKIYPQNPLVISVFKSVCSGGKGIIPLPSVPIIGGGGKGGGIIPFPPAVGGGSIFPFPRIPIIGGDGGGGVIPFPPKIPIIGGGGVGGIIPFPPKKPIIGGGSSSGGIIPLPLIPIIGGGDGAGIPIPPPFLSVPDIGGGEIAPTPSTMI